MPFAISAHFMVRKAAMEVAGELYEKMMSNDALFKRWKELNPGLEGGGLEKAFIMKNWPRCIPVARATLAVMLRGPLADGLKEEIVDALHKDQTLRAGRPDNIRKMGF